MPWVFALLDGKAVGGCRAFPGEIELQSLRVTCMGLLYLRLVAKTDESCFSSGPFLSSLLFLCFAEANKDRGVSAWLSDILFQNKSEVKWQSHSAPTNTEVRITKVGTSACAKKGQ